MSAKWRGPSGRADRFAREAEQSAPGLLRELFELVREDRKWWMVPVLVALLVTGLVVLLGGTSAAPFIYTLF